MKACIQAIKAKQSLYYTYALVSSALMIGSALMVGFFPDLKSWHSNHSQTSRPAFQPTFQAFYNRKTPH